MNRDGDLFDFLLAGYEAWKGSMKVSINGQDRTLILEDGSIEGRFVNFCQAYLKLNPVVATGPAPGNMGFGLILRDQTRILLVKGDTQTPYGDQFSIGINARDAGPYDRLPNSFSMPIVGRGNEVKPVG